MADAFDNISWSTYAYVWNNPIVNIDPDGRHGENIGVDRNGAIVFDDGKRDGNLYLVNENVGEINNLQYLQDNSTQLAQDGSWIAGEDAFDSFIKSQVSYINDSGNNILPYTAYFRRGENQPYNAKASVISNMPITQNTDGSVSIQRTNVQLFIPPSVWDFSDINDLRFTLANELYHLTRPSPENFNSINALNNYFNNNVEEIQSSRFQVAHWTRINAPTKSVQKAEENLRLQIRIGRLRGN